MTEITYNGKEIVKMEAHEDVEGYLWFRFIGKDGNAIDTYVFRGEV